MIPIWPVCQDVIEFHRASSETVDTFLSVLHLDSVAHPVAALELRRRPHSLG